MIFSTHKKATVPYLGEQWPFIEYEDVLPVLEGHGEKYKCPDSSTNEWTNDRDP